MASDVNNPLRTLKYELFAYVGLAIFSRLGFLRRTSSLLIVLAIAFSLFVFAPLFISKIHFGGSAYHLGRYEFCFLLGVLAFHFREQVSLSAWSLVLSAAFVIACHDTAFEAAAYTILTAHLVIVFGTRDYGILSAYNRKSDISYGTYIYGWPVQQSLVLVPGIGTYLLLVLSLMIVPLFAIVSWHVIEKPVLELKKFDPRTLFFRSKAAVTFGSK